MSNSPLDPNRPSASLIDDTLYLRASSLGQCPTALYHALNGFEPVWQPAVLTAFAEGHTREQSILEELAPEIYRHIPLPSVIDTAQLSQGSIEYCHPYLPIIVQGTFDLVIAHKSTQTATIIDAKALSEKSVYQSLKSKYIMQLSVYAHSFRTYPITHAFFAVYWKKAQKYELIEVTKELHTREYIDSYLADVYRDIILLPNRECKDPQFMCPFSYLHTTTTQMEEIMSLPTDPLIESYQSLDELIKNLSKQRDELKAEILSTYQPGKYQVGDCFVSVTSSERSSYAIDDLRQLLTTNSIPFDHLKKTTATTALSIKRAD